MQVQAISNVAAKIDLAGLAACQGLAHRTRPQVAAIGYVQTLDAGETLFAEGDAAANVYQVISGTLRLYKALPDGRRQIVDFPSAEQVLGLSLADQHVYTAEAITEVTLRRYPRAWFERLIAEVPGLAGRLLAAARDELRAAQDQMLLLGRKTAEERIASFLLMLAGRSGALAQRVAVPMSRSDIADYLGLTMETVSRMFAKMKQDGVIALPSPVRVELRDRARLADLAAGAGAMH